VAGARESDAGNKGAGEGDLVVGRDLRLAAGLAPNLKGIIDDSICSKDGDEECELMEGRMVPVDN